MKVRNRYLPSLIVMALVLLLLASAVGSYGGTACHCEMNPGVVPPNCLYPLLVASWWQWAFSLQATGHPLLDMTGAYAYNGQPRCGVFYLGGGFSPAKYKRSVTLRPDAMLFIAVYNSWADIIGMDPRTPITELRDIAASYQEGVTDVHASIDGRKLSGLSAYRVKSPVFAYKLPAQDNVLDYLFGIDVFRDYWPASKPVYPAVADGYYLLLKPLPRGRHVLRFGATDPWGNVMDVTYHVTVPFR